MKTSPCFCLFVLMIVLRADRVVGPTPLIHMLAKTWDRLMLPINFAIPKNTRTTITGGRWEKTLRFAPSGTAEPYWTLQNLHRDPIIYLLAGDEESSIIEPGVTIHWYDLPASESLKGKIVSIGDNMIHPDSDTESSERVE